MNIHISKSRVVTGVVALAILVTGVVIGHASASSAPQAAAVERATTTTTGRTPNFAACRTALDEADKHFNETGDLFGIVRDSIQALSQGDIAGFTAASEKLTKATDSLNFDAYKAARELCH